MPNVTWKLPSKRPTDNLRADIGSSTAGLVGAHLKREFLAPRPVRCHLRSQDGRGNAFAGSRPYRAQGTTGYQGAGAARPKAFNATLANGNSVSGFNGDTSASLARSNQVRPFELTKL
jgi:hypothetical protein